MIAGVAVPTKRVILPLFVCKLVPMVDHKESSLVFRAAENGGEFFDQTNRVADGAATLILGINLSEFKGSEKLPKPNTDRAPIINQDV